MRRREFIAGLGGAAVWPLNAGAQQGERVRRVGILQVGSRIGIGHLHVDAFKSALSELGWVEDRLIRHEERWADDSPELLPILAMGLVKVGPDVIFLTDSPCLRAMRRATSDIPIVFAAVADPVGQGFVSSLARPGGNITGFALGEFSLVTKALDFLKKLAPNIDRVEFLYDPTQPAAAGTGDEIEAAALSFGLRPTRAPVRTAEDIEVAIAALARTPNSGLMVAASPAADLHRKQIAMLAQRHRVPAIYPFRYFVDGGGLASYGPDHTDLNRRAASYVDRILKGEKPRDLPVQLPTKFEFVVNLSTAKALGLTVPPTILAIANEVIE